MKGYFGKYLDVDLVTNSFRDYEIPRDWMKKHLGGRGIATRILLNELKGGEDPLGPENVVVFGTGPLQGTGVAGASKYLVMSKSPKTDTINESYAGGYFGHELGTSGYDGIIIRGAAKSPVYISLIDGKAQIHDAEQLWGLDVRETVIELEKRHPGARVACIGPAGEKLVLFSCIMGDIFRAHGRPGWGAVLGAKKLKAVVVKGGKKKPLADSEYFKKMRGNFHKLILKSPYIQNLSSYGTAGDVNALNTLGILPTRNFQEGVFDGASKISGETMAETILVKRVSCFGCPVQCDRVVETKFLNQKVTPEYGGPEYETIAALGSLCLVDDLSAIALANQKCNQYGLDTISTGNLIAFCMEATERGLMQGPRWGDANGMLKLIDDIAHREGLGDFLAKGLVKVAEEVGGSDFAVHVKGLEVAMHEPRGKVGLAISYATSPRGATHLEAMHDTMLEVDSPIPELGVTESVSRFDWQDKPRLCKLFEDLYSFSNSAIICGFISWDISTTKEYPYGKIREMLSAVTGFNITAEEMIKIGERNYAIRKIASARDGYTRKDDRLPKRLQEPLPRGASANRPISDEVLQKAIDEYYQLRGFNQFGPTKRKLEELDLKELKDLIPEYDK